MILYVVYIKELRSKIAVVPQEPTMLPLSLKGNLGEWKGGCCKGDLRNPKGSCLKTIPTHVQKPLGTPLQSILPRNVGDTYTDAEVLTALEWCGMDARAVTQKETLAEALATQVFRERGSDHKSKGDRHSAIVCFPRNASVQWQPDGLTIHTKKRLLARSRISRSSSHKGIPYTCKSLLKGIPL